MHVLFEYTGEELPEDYRELIEELRGQHATCPRSIIFSLVSARFF